MAKILVDSDVLEQALAALEYSIKPMCWCWAGCEECDPEKAPDIEKASAALKAALAQEQAEPATNEALRLAGLALIGLAEHDQHCEVFDVDDEGRHKACTCGLSNAIAVITQAGKIAPPKAELAQQPEPAQEPVGEMRLSEIIDGMVVPAVPAVLPVGTKLYAAPPQCPPLTDEEIDEIFRDLCSTPVGASYRTMARAIERAVRGEA